MDFIIRLWLTQPKSTESEQWRWKILAQLPEIDSHAILVNSSPWGCPIWSDDFIQIREWNSEPLIFYFYFFQCTVGIRHRNLFGFNLYGRAAQRIINGIEQILDQALSLVLKCRGSGLIKRVFTIIPAAAFCNMSSQLDILIGGVFWLLRVSAPIKDRDDKYLGFH